MKLFALILLLFLSIPKDKPQVWFAPNEGSRDMVSLFIQPDLWRSARQEIDVFHFYYTQVLKTACQNCEENTLQKFIDADAFSKLKKWKKEVALGAGAIKEWDCSGQKAALTAIRAIKNIRANGGEVHYVAMDEPFLGAEKCRVDFFPATDRTVAFIRSVERANPGVSIGDIEPYPYFSATRLEQWIHTLDDKLRKTGSRLAFFQLDVDLNHVDKDKTPLKKDLIFLSSLCRERGIPFGVIFNGPDSRTNQEYFNKTLNWVKTVGSFLETPPDQMIFQSWARDGKGEKKVPYNLPEFEPYTHTHLINEALKLLKTTEHTEATEATEKN